MTDTPIFDAVKADLGGDPRSPIARLNDVINTVLAGLGCILGFGDLSADQVRPPELYGTCPPCRPTDTPIYYELLLRKEHRWAAREYEQLTITYRRWLVGDPA
jgi:hypothetical protein